MSSFPTKKMEIFFFVSEFFLLHKWVLQWMKIMGNEVQKERNNDFNLDIFFYFIKILQTGVLKGFSETAGRPATELKVETFRRVTSLFF